jgi:hypothetical protein
MTFQLSKEEQVHKAQSSFPNTLLAISLYFDSPLLRDTAKDFFVPRTLHMNLCGGSRPIR